MSDGISDANRTARKVADVEDAADSLMEALERTGEIPFHTVHPQAVGYANEILRECGYELVSTERLRAGARDARPGKAARDAIGARDDEGLVEACARVHRELLAAREALRAADALAEASIDVCAVGVGVYLARCLACGSQATGPAGVEPDHAEDCALAAYRAARGAR